MTEEEDSEQSPDANSDKKAFGKDVGKLVSGTVVAQVAAILTIPIITRIFGPEIYGVMPDIKIYPAHIITYNEIHGSCYLPPNLGN